MIFFSGIKSLLITLPFFGRKSQKVKILTISILVIMVIDCIVTAYATMCFMVRMIKNNNIEMDNSEQIERAYDRIYSNESESNFIYKFFGDEKMIKTFPRLKVEDKNGNIIYFSDLLPDITPYYLKIGD